jgi:PIN domain nuclease of toxin-antitoxin system
VVVSAASLGDLWYSSHKVGKRALTPGAYESLRETVLNPASRFEVMSIDVETMDHLERFPREVLADPWDRLIVATASQLGLPLVSRDRAISVAGVVQVIW